MLKCMQMSPSAGGVAPQHLLPYELELGADVTLESLIQYVFHMEKRPSIPKDWALLPQVFSHSATHRKMLFSVFAKIHELI